MAAAIICKISHPILKFQVKILISGSQSKVAGHRLHCFKDKFPGDLDDLSVTIHIRTMLCEDIQRLLRRELDTCTLKNFECRVLDKIQLHVI